jgi:hypothetical protein
MKELCRIKAASDAYNADIERRYGPQNEYRSPKSAADAAERLKQLRSEFSVTPNYQMGGSVYPVNYVPEAQEGIELSEYDIAMRGMMKSKIGMGNAFGNPAIKRMSQAMPKTGMTPEGIGTHYMGSMDNYAVPLLQDFGGDELKLVNPNTRSKEAIRFNSPEEAQYFAEHYKDVAPMSTTFKGLQEYAMGGSIPGSVGFTYARTQSPAPSNGPYAKKTMASAQNGIVTGKKLNLPDGKAFLEKLKAENAARNDWRNVREVPRTVVNDNIPNAHDMAVKADAALVKQQKYEQKVKADQAKAQADAQKKFNALPKKEQQRIIDELRNQQYGSISQYEPEGFWEKAGNIALAPFTALREKMETGHVPDNLVKGIVNDPKNMLNPMDVAYLGTLGYAAAPYVSQAVAAAAPYVSSALATQLPGMAAVPGATVGNAITAGFATHGLTKIGPDSVKMYENPSWENAFHVAMDVAEVLPVAGPAVKTIGEGLYATGRALGTESGLLSKTPHWLKRFPKVNTFEQLPSSGNVVGEIVNKSITPIGYDPFTVAAAPLELLTPKALKFKPQTYATKNRFDAWRLYNGLEPEFNTFFKNADGTLAINDFRLGKDSLQKIVDNPKKSFGTMEIEKEFNFGGVHGNGWITKGIDDQGRKFIDFTDTWDLQPLKRIKGLPKKVKEFEVSSLTGGKPFDLKNRIYYDDAGNFFDHNGNELVEEMQHFTKGVVDQNKAVDLPMLSTKNIVGTKQMDVLNDWNKATNQKFLKGVLTAVGGVGAGVGYLVNKEKEKLEKENTPPADSQIEQKKQGGIIKDNLGQWNYPGKITQIAQEGRTITLDEGEGRKKTMLTDSKEYANLYNEGRIGVQNDDESISFNPLNEVVVTPYDKYYPYYQNLSAEEKKHFNDDTSIGRAIRSKAQDGVGFNADKATDFAMGWLRDLPLAGVQASQSALVEGVEALRGNESSLLNIIEPGKQRLPSDVWGIENDYYTMIPAGLPGSFMPVNLKTVGNTAMDIVADPILIEGFLKQPLQKGIRQLRKIKTNIDPNFNFTDQLAIQKERLLNPKIKDKFFKYQRKLNEDNIANKLAKSRADVNNRITPENYDDFIEKTQSGYLEELASIHNKYPHNLGVSSYGEIPVVFKDAPFNKLQKSAIAGHEGNHSLFANTISKEMGEDILKPFGGTGSRPVRGYPDKHQVDEVFARMSQMKNAFGMKGNEKFTRAHLDKIRKSYSKEFLDNSIDDMLTKIPPGSKQEANFIKNMNKYAFGIAAGLSAAGLSAASQLEEEPVPGMKQGGVIKDDMGQWNHPGEITEIGSNQITMQGVPYPVLGISDTGDTKLMKPGKDYKFKGKKVTEFPMAKNGIRQEQKGLVNLDQLTNFTNYNKPTVGGWLDKY